MNRLQNKTAIVTGAARGIGLAIAERFASAGADVLLVDLDREAVRASASALGKNAAVADVSSRSEVQRVVDSAAADWGRIDIVVNNAGIFRRTPLLDLTEREFDDVIAVNLKSALFMIQAVAPLMIASNSGAIVNIASVAALLATPGALAYCASKAALTQLTNAAAIELAPHGIRVNAVGPGTISTEMSSSAYADADALREALSRIPLGRTGRPEEIADIALFLACDASSYVTGKTIYADGGRLGLNLTVPVEAR